MKVSLPGGPDLVLFDSIQELPQALETKMQGYLLEDMGVGNTPHQLLKHLQNALSLIDKTPNRAKTEIEHALYCYQNGMDNYDASKLAWACLIKSIDGKPVTDHSEANLKEILNYLSENGLNSESLDDTFCIVKKNLRQSWTITSPLETLENQAIYNYKPA
jgi:hypothetical protein